MSDVLCWRLPQTSYGVCTGTGTARNPGARNSSLRKLRAISADTDGVKASWVKNDQAVPGVQVDCDDDYAAKAVQYKREL